MIKEQRKYCYGVYTLMFLLMCIVAFLPFFTEGKSFVWGAGVEDGLSQHFSALAYYGEALREFFRNLLAGHPKLVMWDMSLGYGADILSTLNYYAIGDPLNLLYGFVSPKNTETMYDFMILLRMYLAGITFIMYARKMKKRSYGTVIGAIAMLPMIVPICDVILISLLTRYPPMNMQIRYTTPPARIEIFHPCAAPRLRIAVTSAVTRQNTTKYKSRSLLSIALAAIRL